MVHPFVHREVAPFRLRGDPASLQAAEDTIKQEMAGRVMVLPDRTWGKRTVLAGDWVALEQTASLPHPIADTTPFPAPDPGAGVAPVEVDF